MLLRDSVLCPAEHKSLESLNLQLYSMYVQSELLDLMHCPAEGYNCRPLKLQLHRVRAQFLTLVTASPALQNITILLKTCKKHVTC